MAAFLGSENIDHTRSLKITFFSTFYGKPLEMPSLCSIPSSIVVPCRDLEDCTQILKKKSLLKSSEIICCCSKQFAKEKSVRTASNCKKSARNANVLYEFIKAFLL